jgi:hypothetical protein
VLRLCGAAAPSAEEQSFGLRTVAAAVGALQIEISNVHVRYEDETSDPSSHFAFGLTLDRLSSLSLSFFLARARALSLCRARAARARTLSRSLSLSLTLSPCITLTLDRLSLYSVDGQWRPTPASQVELAAVAKKMLKIEGFAMYWQHCPQSMGVRRYYLSIYIYIYVIKYMYATIMISICIVYMYIYYVHYVCVCIYIYTHTLTQCTHTHIHTLSHTNSYHTHTHTHTHTHAQRINDAIVNEAAQHLFFIFLLFDVRGADFFLFLIFLNE